MHSCSMLILFVIQTNKNTRAFKGLVVVQAQIGLIKKFPPVLGARKVGLFSIFRPSTRLQCIIKIVFIQRLI